MPAKKKNATQLRGAVNNIILESLYSGEKYGYEIIKEVEEKTNGKIKLKQPSLYSSLKRFEAKNYIKSYWADSDIGGKRHYYSLTSEGIAYYRKNILKENDVEFVDDEDEMQEVDKEKVETEQDFEETYEIDKPEENINNFSKYSFSVQDKLNQLLSDDIENEDQQEVSEHEEILNDFYKHNETVYSEDDLVNDQKEIEEKEQIPADHEFRTPTPLIDEITKQENLQNENEKQNPIGDNEQINLTKDSKDEIIANKPQRDSEYSYNFDQHNAYDDITKIEEVVSDNALDDLLFHDEDETELNTVVKDQQEEKPQIYTDEFGITKMYYPDKEEKVVNKKVYDNVVYRTNSNSIFDKTEKSSKPTGLQLDELSDKEREERTSRFIEKFENRTKELTANKEPAEEPVKEQPISVDYKKVLTGLYDSNKESESFEQDKNASFISQEEQYVPVEEPENQETAYIPTNNIDYTVKIYSEEKKKQSQSKYLLVNKARFTFGLIMLLFMLIQITTMLIVFKNKGILLDKQYWIFQVSYVIIALVTLYFCIPVFISPNKQATNSFKLGYMLMFGILAFFIVVILAYAINTFLGMELSKINYYLPTLVVPSVLALNFVFGPIIYKIITQNKRLY